MWTGGSRRDQYLFTINWSNGSPVTSNINTAPAPGDKIAMIENILHHKKHFKFYLFCRDNNSRVTLIIMYHCQADISLVCYDG